jgi:regulator of sigma E protease
MTGIVQSLITILVFILLLGSLVLVHEVGHFITARWAKVRVLEFGIGFPPRARVLGRGKRPAYDAGRRPRPDPALPPGVEPGSDEAEAFLAAARTEDAEAGATLYTLNWLPIGGFVKLEGEDGSDDADPHSFANAKLWIKVGILLAGVTMNLLLAFAIFTGIALVGEPGASVAFAQVAPASPAEEAGLRAGDAVYSVDGRTYSIFDVGTGFAIDDLGRLAGQEVVLGIVHPDGATENLTVQLRVPVTATQGALGISRFTIKPYGTVTYTPAAAISAGAERTVDAFGLIVAGLGDLGRSIVTSPTTAPPASGPVGIAVEIGDVLWNLGPIYVLYMAALLSANLALVNVLPFPPLDGGRILMILLKAIPGYGKRISVRAEQLTYAVGFVALFTFLIWITVFDVARQVGGGQ